MRRRLVIRGEAYVTLETVAECYDVEVRWVQEVVDLGLLEPEGGPEAVDEGTAVAAAQLERFAEILRWQRQLGVNLEGIALLLRR